jgi:hypothetical protein
MTPAAMRQHHRARTLDDPRFERYRSPHARRRLASALIALLLVEGGLLVAMDHVVWPALITLAVTVAAFVVCLGTLKASTRGIEELPEAVLDERQWEIRGQVFATSYRIGTTLLVTGLATVALWALLDLPEPARGVVAAAILLPFQAALVLPTVVAALRNDI